jgi:hypothetical protein
VECPIPGPREVPDDRVSCPLSCGLSIHPFKYPRRRTNVVTPGRDAETRFLVKAREAGFGIGFCSDQQPSTAIVETPEPGIWLKHAGPGQPFIVNRRRIRPPGLAGGRHKATN